MKTSYSCKILSHPDKTLPEHLGNVYELVNLFNLLKDEDIQKLLKVITQCHDFGKSTSYFQKYLIDHHQNEYKNHAKLSAIFAFYLVQKLNIKADFIPYIAILAHHGNLSDTESVLRNAEIGHIEKKQIKSIDLKEIDNIYGDTFSLDSEDFKNFICEAKEFGDLIYDSAEKLKKTTIKDYFLVLYLFSLLIDADKLDAGFNDKEKIEEIFEKIQSFNIPNFVDTYKAVKFQNIQLEGLNKLREDIYSDALEYVKNADLNQHILSINVPTGLGKTLTSLSYALKFKDRLIKEKGINPKIVYCLPFTSIIDQNYSVIEDIFRENNLEPLGYRLLKHHHIADIDYTDEDDEFGKDKSLLLTENWMSSIIVTSFVQFFHSLISNRNKSLKKFHNIANSIIILDEVQSIPHKYWKLVNKSLQTFSQMFNTYFILVTATQPMIFNESKNEIVEVIGKKEEYFKSPLLNRICLENNLISQNLEEFKQNVLDDINKNKDKSFLIILNTIKSSQATYDFIKENTENEDVLYLSTTIIPKERFEIIKKVKNANKRIILVSTQVVEAGVDIDLDIVYRDLAPLDSIFQSAGRCNRNSVKERGIVKVVNITDDKNNKPFSQYVYDAVLLDETKKVLSKKKNFSENDFLELAKEYYNALVLSNNDSNEILNHMEKLNFETVNKNFRLIEEKCKSMDFFIESTSEAKELIKKYDEIRNDENLKPFEKKHKFLEIRGDFYKYVISVRLKLGQERYFEQSPYSKYKLSPCYIPFDEHKMFYESNAKGFNFDKIAKLETESIII